MPRKLRFEAKSELDLTYDFQYCDGNRLESPIEESVRQQLKECCNSSESFFDITKLPRVGRRGLSEL